jgi:hypothetical protein
LYTYAPRAIVILSQWPFFTLFEHFLKIIYRVSLSTTYIPGTFRV